MSVAGRGVPDADPGAPPGNAPAQHLRRYLELGAVQLAAAMKEADTHAGSLAAAVGGLSTDALGIEQCANELLSDDAARVEHARGRVVELAGRLSGHAHAAISALQFYDKLVQRLTHVREGLVIPADRLHHGMSAEDCEALLDAVRACYSMVEERVLFDFLMRGIGANAMFTALVSMRERSATGEPELF
jgi:hypothetical protein